ncbi:S8 family serine peptidase [Niabella sp. CC-SYL272]|uniref:S8 family peptidase n=1 Tax=Niabella agricola TaxID=2891571 RepID=UPI001F1C5873|nr:S8 family peptidase [Niabella agricola]MCF3111473.1 S8 family serine peptidase [Niabella agricola]
MKPIFSFVAVLATLGILFCGCQKNSALNPEVPLSAQSQGDLQKLALSTGSDYEPNEVLVKFKENILPEKKTAILNKINGHLKEKIITKLMARLGDQEGLSLLEATAGTMATIEKLKAMPEVEYAEPNYIYQHFATSNDPYFLNGSLWGMYGSTTTPANNYGSQAAAAWASGNTGSATVYVGIIDEGYMYMHEDLQANAGVNPGEIPGNGVDDDHNGYVDDVYGWDFVSNNNSVFDGTSDDHGTHVAGTIGAVGGNGKGVAGMCWNVKLLSGKFLGTNGGTTANAIKAIDYFTNLKLSQGLNIVATNNSWGGGGFSQALQDAIERANNAGILFVAAAGNSTNNNDANPSYPASYPNANIIAVAAITNSGALASFSNYGSTTVDLGAPGASIYSTVPVNLKRNKIGSGYASYSGTSMATPHVTGAVALYASTHPGATAAAVKNAILTTTTPTASLAGKCATGGRLNVSSF